MKHDAPKVRYETAEARQSIAKKLTLPYHDRMQDWPWEVAEPKQIEKYIRLYDSLQDEDELFVLMEVILQATMEQPSTIELEKYWLEVKARLVKNVQLHQWSIFYWCIWETEELENCWQIAPYIRDLWIELKSNNAL